MEDVPAKKPWYKTRWGILAILALWPFSLSYWIWKRDWSQNKRIGFIAGLWIFIFFVASFQLASTSSYQQGYQAGREAAMSIGSVQKALPPTAIPTFALPTITLIPTVQTEATPTITSTPTVITTKRKLKENPSVYLYYSTSMKEIFTEQSEASTELGNGLSKWPDLTDREIIALAANTVVLEQSYDKAVTITAPIELRATHQKYIKSYKLIKDAMPILRDGLDNNDGSLVTQASSKITQSGKLTKEANQELWDFVAYLQN
ncbi:hypothetical protein HZB96_01370 [Candidatus Gottesmanbacteria bacterium]|nr:hypothetical protein [Candidatus Gottesmanbacteria bacterium]